ncbi:MAG: hypothetical protein KC466_00225, partial [Myxococcales bacterium]|nr:hypothetical protein [Myxococcales bacterium]
MTSRRRVSRAAWIVGLVSAALAGPAGATQPPAPGVVPDAPTIAAITRLVSSAETHGYLASVRDARLCRAAAASGRKVACQEAVKGQRSIPILAVEFQNRAAPYARQVLQDVLFDDNPTGTMTDYYDEISYG